MLLINVSNYLKGHPVVHLRRMEGYSSDIYQNLDTGALARLPLFDGESCPDNLVCMFCLELGIPVPDSIKGFMSV